MWKIRLKPDYFWRIFVKNQTSLDPSTINLTVILCSIHSYYFLLGSIAVLYFASRQTLSVPILYPKEDFEPKNKEENLVTSVVLLLNYTFNSFYTMVLWHNPNLTNMTHNYIIWPSHKFTIHPNTVNPCRNYIYLINIT